MRVSREDRHLASRMETGHAVDQAPEAGVDQKWLEGWPTGLVVKKRRLGNVRNVGGNDHPAIAFEGVG